jgi:ketosteroid isomerase-like protein
MKGLMTLLIVLATSFSVLGECSDAERKALIEFDKAWTDANAKGDPAAIAAFYADEFTVFPALTGKKAAVDGAIAAFERNKANPQAVARTTADHYMINCTPTTATIVHRNVIFNPTANGGSGATTYGRSVHFLEKRNGKWVAVSNAGGPLSDADVLRYMELDWINAVKSRDVDWMEKNYAADFAEVSFMSGEVNNKQRTLEIMRADKTVFDSMEASDLNIRVEGNTALVTGMGHARGKSADGKPFDVKLRYTDAFVKRDGKWQIWSSQATMIPAPEQTAKN